MPRTPSRNTGLSSIFSLGGGAAQTELTKDPAANVRRRLASANAVIATLWREWSNGFSIFMFTFRFSITPPLQKPLKVASRFRIKVGPGKRARFGVQLGTKPPPNRT